MTSSTWLRRTCALAAVLVLSNALAARADLTAYVPVSANGSYQTSLELISLTASPATFNLALHYYDSTGSQHTSNRAVLVPARGTVLYSNAYTELFTAPEGLYGWIEIFHSTNGMVTSALWNGVGIFSFPVTYGPLSLGSPAGETDQIEKSATYRTNLILTEVSGGWADVELTLLGPNGNVVQTRTFSVSPFQYFQINDLFGPNGFDLRRMPVGGWVGFSVRAEVVGGDGHVAAVATKIRNSDGYAIITNLGDENGGGDGGGTIGF